MSEEQELTEQQTKLKSNLNEMLNEEIKNMIIKQLYKLDNEKHNRYYHGEWYVEAIDVVGETSRSYIIKKYSREIKVNKKTLLSTPDWSGISDKYYLSEQDAKDAIWLKANRRNIIDALERSNEIELFKEIAKKLGV